MLDINSFILVTIIITTWALGGWVRHDAVPVGIFILFVNNFLVVRLGDNDGACARLFTRLIHRLESLDLLFYVKIVCLDYQLGGIAWILADAYLCSVNEGTEKETDEKIPQKQSF